MTAFVEECRKEWKRLGVPDLLADEMAAELEADLTEAEADGIAAAEFLGESDPRRFAATWATERGLVPKPQAPKSRKRLWIALAACVVLVCVALSTLALIQVGNEPAHAANPVKVPRLVGLKACDAVRVGHLAGLAMLHTVYRSRCHARVVYQKPAAGTYVPLHAPTTIRLRLVRTPRLVGLNVCSAKQVAARQGLHVVKSWPGQTTTENLPASSMCKNFVLSQTPAAGHLVRRPVTVTVRVSCLSPRKPDCTLPRDGRKALGATSELGAA